MDAARELFDSLNTVADIQDLIGKEEDLFLEVKRATVPMSQDDKANLSKALSGFANSSGGVLIFGLFAQSRNKDEPDVISKEDPITDLERFLPDVQTLIGKAVVPFVDGVMVKAIRYEKDPIRGFALVLVPESDRGPHRAMLRDTCKQYYKRSGDSFYVMEHFDLADMFGKRRRPDLRFAWRLAHISFSSDKPYKFSLILGLENVGRGLARYPLLALEHLSGATLSEYGVDGNKNQGLPIVRGDQSIGVTFAGGINDVIHPATIKEIVGLGKFEVNSLSDVKFKLIIAAEDLEANSREIVIGSQIIKKRLSDPSQRTEWVYV